MCSKASMSELVNTKEVFYDALETQSVSKVMKDDIISVRNKAKRTLKVLNENRENEDIKKVLKEIIVKLDHHVNISNDSSDTIEETKTSVNSKNDCHGSIYERNVTIREGHIDKLGKTEANFRAVIPITTLSANSSIE